MHSEIRLIHRDKINVQAYDRCVEASPNSKIYALSGWLDIVHPNWSALVYGDYEGVMPFAIKTTWFRKKVVQPPFTQQLGLFTSNLDFFNMAQTGFQFLRDHYSKILYQGNHYMTELDHEFNIRMRNNFVLKWSEEGLADYRESHQRKIKKLRKNNSTVHEASLPEFTAFFQEHNPVYSSDIAPRKDKFNKLLHFLLENDLGAITKCTNGAEMEACIFWGKYKDTLYYLFPAVNSVGRKKGSNIFLIHETPQHLENIQFIDFEGSDIPGIEHFLLGFNPMLSSYPLFQV